MVVNADVLNLVGYVIVIKNPNLTRENKLTEILTF